MHGLIKHFLKTNREEVLRRSLINCHAQNVHSVMLAESPGKTIRIFIAEPGHTLWQNDPNFIEEQQSVAFHAHHCELTLIPVYGRIQNWVVSEAHSGFAIDEYQYQSAITGKEGKIGFIKFGQRVMETVYYIQFGLDEEVYMHSRDVHTVIVGQDEWAAWMVIEGRENPHHNNHCWSYAPLDKQDFSHLYKPMPEHKLEALMSFIMP